MMNKIKNSKKGFTMVELTLAMVFISIILITIAWLTMYITSIYQKGLAMKAVNATAKELIDDFTRAIEVAPARTIESQCSDKYTSSTSETSPYQKCIKDKARKFTYQQHYATIKIHGEGDEKVVPIYGAFCTGRYSYVWNTAYALNDEEYIPTTGGIINTALDYRAIVNGKNDFRLLKIQDYSKQVCSEHVLTTEYLYDDGRDYSMHDSSGTVISEDAIINDLLDNSENDLALYDMSVFKPTVHQLTSAAYYSGTFILATLRGGIDITESGEFCADPPDGLVTDFNYCAINKFNFAMRAAGEKMETERLRK